ncbi:phosphodiesterase [Parasedimentitalea psychrophila]|uniref:phosphodiesterase n=1 Tax=Parasedimentitalea psychrophila TaxID=2997337 RepID=UPI0022EB5A56|nr:phosphodiesterase [Parasedimentitalea psychrophila]
MLIAQISDPHIVEPGRKTCDVAPTSERLAQLVSCLNKLDPLPDVALITGDITHDGTAAQAAQAKHLLDPLKMPYHVVPGNHDDRTTLAKVFSGSTCPAQDEEFLHYVIEDHDIRLIGLDSTKPGAPGGEICQRRADWLQARLNEAPERPTVLFMHHPPVKFGVLETDEDGFQGADLLEGLVERFPNIERILCGHIHLTAHTQWRGTVVSTAPSAGGMRLALDLTLKKSSGFHLTNPEFQLHHRTTDGGLVTHQVEVLENDKLYLF